MRHVVQLGDRWIGQVVAGVIESTDRFRTLSGPPLRFGQADVLAVSARVRPHSPGDVYWVATRVGELSRCDSNGCSTAFLAPVRSVRAFADGHDLAGDADGGIWRFADGEWTRQRIASASIISLDGVPDGGPRFARTADTVFESEDHGLTWAPTERPEARHAWGSGGLRAWRAADGSLQVRDLNGSVRPIEGAGSIPEQAPILWASPELIVVGLADGVLAVEWKSGETRHLSYPTAGTLEFHTARVVGPTLQVFAGRTVQHFDGPAVAGWSADRLWRQLHGQTGVFLGVFVAVLVGLFITFDVGLKRRRRVGRR